MFENPVTFIPYIGLGLLWFWYLRHQSHNKEFNTRLRQAFDRIKINEFNRQVREKLGDVERA